MTKIKSVLLKLYLKVASFIPVRIRLRLRRETGIIRAMDYPSQIYLNIDSDIEYEVRMHSCKKEPDTVAWIENWFKPKDTIYDIGANVGAYSFVAFKYLRGDTKIYAFEPAFTTYSQLCKNIYLNSADKAIIPFQIALSNKTGIDTLNYRDLISGSALNSLGEPINPRGKEFKPVLALPTLSYALDDFIQRFELAKPNHIKIDVDGTESNILLGAVETLKSRELKTLMIEVNPHHSGAQIIKKTIEDCGMTLHSQYGLNCLYCRIQNG